MTDWVPVMAPPPLAARFLREVADHLAREEDDTPRPWDDATGSDIADFVRQLNDDQRRLVVSLAFAEHPHSAGAHAGRLGVSVDDVAGYVGPVNKRAKKLGWASPVRSQRHFNGKTTDKVLVLDDRLASWVKDHNEEDNRT